MIRQPLAIPADVFTEPSDVDPNTLNNLGPLRRLAGRWTSAGGVDVNPKALGPERRTFIENIEFQAIDPQANGPQLLYGLRYHIHITTEEEDITFHEQVGYWLWEPATGLIMQTVAIPRGQVALASGHAEPDDDEFTVSASRGDSEYGISSTEFLDKAFRTDSYNIKISFHGENSWSYVTDTQLLVHGRNDLFTHQDRNTLHRVAGARPNPLAAMLARRASRTHRNTNADH